MIMVRNCGGDDQDDKDDNAEHGKTGSGRVGTFFSPLGLKVANTFYFEVVPMF